MEAQNSNSLFLNRAYAIVKAHLSDEHFGILVLCKELGISRSQLHRKLKEHANISTAHFIRRIRLKEAVNLLKKTDYSISEIAYLTGFSNPVYFTQIFKIEFGISPSTLRKALKNKARLGGSKRH